MTTKKYKKLIDGVLHNVTEEVHTVKSDDIEIILTTTYSMVDMSYYIKLAIKTAEVENEKNK